MLFSMVYVGIIGCYNKTIDDECIRSVYDGKGEKCVRIVKITALER